MRSPQSADFQPSGDELTLDLLCTAVVDARAPRDGGLFNGSLPLADHGHGVIGCGSSGSSGGDLFGISVFSYRPHSMNTPCYTVAMDLGVCQLRNFSISFLSSLLGAESSHVRLENRYIIPVL